MSPLTLPSALPESDGRWKTEGGVVWWRLGRHAADDSPGAVARGWAEEIVRAEHLFEWRGFARTARTAKPQLARAPGADFNISHSGGFVLAAVGVGVHVGVDIEAAPYAAFLSTSLQRRMLNRTEADHVASLADESRLNYLARVWTAKEALVKATGEGMRRDFRRVDVPAPVHAPSQPVEACLVALAPLIAPRFHRLTCPS